MGSKEARKDTLKKKEEFLFEALGHHFKLDPLLASDFRKLTKKLKTLTYEEVDEIALKYRDMILNMKPIQKLAWDIDKRAQCQRRYSLQFLALSKKTRRQLKKFRKELEKEVKPKKEKSK